jgi:hypothetical protein
MGSIPSLFLFAANTTFTMTKLLTIILALTFISPVTMQKKADYGLLKKVDEMVVYSFNLKSNGKTAILCRQKDSKYLVYRFGTKDKVELQYPAIPDNNSWKLFKYEGYSRGGGKANDAEEIHSVEFFNAGVTYKMCDDWNANHGSDVEIIVQSTKRPIYLIGNIHSKIGSLSSLRDYADLIPNRLDDESN